MTQEADLAPRISEARRGLGTSESLRGELKERILAGKTYFRLRASWINGLRELTETPSVPPLKPSM